MMVDAGVPNKMGVFKRRLDGKGIRPEEIKLIVLTHSHFDHSGSAHEIRDLTGAEIAIHESERVYLENGGMIIPKGVNMVYPGHGNPFPVEVMKKIID